MKRLHLPVEVVALVLWLVAYLLFYSVSPEGYVYRWSSNGGVILTSPVGCVGLEVYGHPGVFGGWDPGECDQ